MPAKLIKKHRVSSGVGRFFLDAIKPAPVVTALGKRSRDAREEDVSSSSNRSSGHVSRPSDTLPACVALQNEDPFLDVVVITALNTIPFCCHADLVTMTRPQLLDAASTMNAKLPSAMRIDTGASCSDVSIRHSIEFLVGLREAPPKSESESALLPASTRPRLTESALKTPRGYGSTPSSPLSPLAGRTRGTRPSLGTPSLAVLEETSEDADTPPNKRRRTDSSLPFTMDPARPITRAQSRRVTPLLMKANAEAAKAISDARREISPALGRVLRTRSTPAYLTSRTPNLVPSGSPRHARRSNGQTKKSKSFAMTSTPKKRATAAVNSPGAKNAHQFRSLFAEVQNLGHAAGRGSGLEKLVVGRVKEMEDSVDDLDVTFGLDGYTISHVVGDDELSDMDISRC